MSERQADRPKDKQKDRRTERQIEECQQDGRKRKDRQTFQLSYQNKSCSECQQDFKQVQNVNKMSKSQTDRQQDRQSARQIIGAKKRQTK